MADAFRFERQKSPEILESESEYARFDIRGEEEDENENPRNNSSWKTSGILTIQRDNVNPISTGMKDQPETSTHQLKTEGYNKGEIIASAKNEKKKEKQELPQKISAVHPEQKETLQNFLGEVEREAADLELIIVPPSCPTAVSTEGPSSIGFKIQEIVDADDPSKEFHDQEGSPELISRLSRIESAKKDIRNLKSNTIGRMGKIFRIRSPSSTFDRGEKTAEQIERDIQSSTITEQQYGQDPTRKEKTHSLGRMLRLVDKDGAPRKLFSHSRAGSLTRLRKMNSTVGNVANNSEESRNIFTRMLNQLRVKLPGRNPTAKDAEPTLQSAMREGEGSPKPSLGTRLMTSLSTRGNSGGGTTVGKTIPETSVERVTV